MRHYHTDITINAAAKKVWKELTNFKDYHKWNPIVGKLEGDIKEGGKISTHIVPLKSTYATTLTSYKTNKEMVWKGSQGSRWILAAEHYYRLVEISENRTELQHGEYFTGILAYFLPKSLITKMHTAFKDHNLILKQRIENRM